VEAVGGELVGGDVVSHDLLVGGIGHEVADELVELLASAGEVLALVQGGGERAAVALLLSDAGVGGKDGFEPVGGVTVLVAQRAELVDVGGSDLSVVPGAQDGVDVGEVLVQGRAPDAGVGGDL
jgi:hypothetical protein